VQQHLESENNGKWFLIIDNADETGVLYESSDSTNGIMQYLSESESCIILFTTRSLDVANSIPGCDIFNLEEMSLEENLSFFKELVNPRQQHLLQDQLIVVELLTKLTHLPLAIAQAATYLNRNQQVSIRKYLELLRGTEDDMVKLMSKEVYDGTLFQRSQRAVATTWLVSFDQIRTHDKNAENLLSFMSCTDPKAIPRSIFPRMEKEEDLVYAIGTLFGYSLLTSGEDGEVFDMHRLVHMATRIWVGQQGFIRQTMTGTIVHLAEIFHSSN
jgi:hypothetical protein